MNRKALVVNKRMLCVGLAAISVWGCEASPKKERLIIRIVDPIVVSPEKVDSVSLASTIQEFALAAAREKLIPNTAYNVEIWTVSETEVTVTFIPVDIANPYQVDVRVSVDAGEPYTLEVRQENLLRPD